MIFLMIIQLVKCQNLNPSFSGPIATGARQCWARIPWKQLVVRSGSDIGVPRPQVEKEKSFFSRQQLIGDLCKQSHLSRKDLSHCKCINLCVNYIQPSITVSAQSGFILCALFVRHCARNLVQHKLKAGTVRLRFLVWNSDLCPRCVALGESLNLSELVS